MADPTIQQLQQELANLVGSVRKVVIEMGQTANASQANARRQVEGASALSDFNAQMVKGRKLTAEQQTLVNDAIKAKREEIKASVSAAKAFNASQDAIDKHGAKSKEAAKALDISNKAQSLHADTVTKSGEAATKVEASFDSLVKGTRLAEAAMVWFGSTVNTQAKQLMAQYQANAGVIEGSDGLLSAIRNQQNTALKLGMTGSELGKIITANRQVVNAMGGTSKAVDELTPAAKRFQLLLGGSMSDSLELAANVARQFAEKGIVPSQAGIASYTNDLEHLAKQTGMNAVQANNYYEELAKDVDTIDLLRSARAGERESILANQRAVLQQSIAMGMSAEQAKEAAKAMGKMKGAKPMDRIRQAAHIRMLGGALGIAGADDAANAVIQGKRGTPEERLNNDKLYQSFMTEVANKNNQAGVGGFDQELFTSQVIDKSGLESLVGKGSPFSTSNADSLKPNAEAMDKLNMTSQDGFAKVVAAINLLYEQGKTVLTGNHMDGVAIAGISAGIFSILGIIALKRAGGPKTVQTIGKLITALTGLKIPGMPGVPVPPAVIPKGALRELALEAKTGIPKPVVPTPPLELVPKVANVKPVTPVVPVEPKIVPPKPVTPPLELVPKTAVPKPVPPVVPVEPIVAVPKPVPPVVPVEPKIAVPKPVPPVVPVEPVVAVPKPSTIVEPVPANPKVAVPKGGGIKGIGMAGKIGVIGAMLGGILDGYGEYQEDGKIGAAVGTGVGSTAGGLGGGWAGAAAGGAIGALGGPAAPITVPLGALIGGIMGSMGGGYVGGKAGKAIGGLADPSTPGTPTAVAPTDTTAQIAAQEATISTSVSMDASIKQIDKQNLILLDLKALGQRQILLGEKMLETMTMTDIEKQEAKKTSVRGDSRIASNYAYI